MSVFARHIPPKMIRQFKIALLGIVVKFVKELHALPLERQAEIMRELDIAVATGDLSRIPPEIRFEL